MDLYWPLACCLDLHLLIMTDPTVGLFQHFSFLPARGSGVGYALHQPKTFVSVTQYYFCISPLSLWFLLEVPISVLAEVCSVLETSL